MWKVLSPGIHMCNMKSLFLLVRKLWSRLKFFKSRSNFKVKVTRSKLTVPCDRSCHKEYTCNMKALSLLVRKLWSKLKFFKSRLNFKVKVTRSKLTVPCERSCHKEYTCNMKALSLLVRKLWSRLKFFKSQGHEVKNYSTMWKVLSQGMHMCNMKSLFPLVRKLWSRLKFLFTRTRRCGHQGYDITSPDIRPGLLKMTNCCILSSISPCVIDPSNLSHRCVARCYLIP